MYFIEKYNDLSELVAFAQNLGILHSRIVEREYYIKMNFEYYQIQKLMLKPVRFEKVHEK